MKGMGKVNLSRKLSKCRTSERVRKVIWKKLDRRCGQGHLQEDDGVIEFNRGWEQINY